MNVNVAIEAILTRAAYQNISTEELNLLVTKTREIRQERETELENLCSLLEELESHLPQ